MEVEKINEIEKVVASVLERHNDSNERTRIDLMLFNHLCRIMLKILRAISMPNGHLINVAMKIWCESYHETCFLRRRPYFKIY